MNISHSATDHEQRERLADLIVRRAGDIEERWLERVKPNFKGRELSPTELRDSMPEYLSRLTDGLRQAGSAQQGGSSSWENVAREHAETRVRLGFDIDQLVQEFITLRQVLFDVIEEERELVDLHQAGRIADLIDGAIAAAVKSYVRSRDYEARRQEAEHVGFITHELRNPLTTAVLGTHQLRQPRRPDERQQTLDLVERNLRRLADLIDGVLLVERDGHAVKPQRILMALGQLLEPSIAAAKLAVESKGLRLETQFDPDVVVQVDSKLATSAIDNVVQNAIKFTDRGEVRVLAEDNVGEVVLHVYDTGPGIPEAELATMFEPFRRGQTVKPGAGLGLAIARRALECQGGTIHAESGEDRGAHFWMTLPKPRH